MKKIKKYLLLLTITLLALAKGSYATHIVGGEISYKCLVGAPLYLYEVTLKFYRDCTSPSNVEFDTVVFLTIRRGIDNNITYNQGIYLPTTDTLDNNTYNLNFISPPNICVEEAIYSTQVYLPPVAGGYYATFQRCCRTMSLLNITNPLGTGTTIYIDFPDSSDATCNSSPVFNLYPPTVICINDTFEFDHSAADLDGDSLVYEICQPYNYDPTIFGSAPTITLAKDPFLNPPYPFVNGYIAGYSFQQPLGVSADLQIDEQSGWLTCHPTQVGQYVVAICVSEYQRGTGKLLSVNKRDFQFNVADCLPFTAINEINSENSVSIFPNPFNEKVWLRIANWNEYTNEKIELKMYNVLGKEIFKQQILNSESEILNTNLNHGIYFFKVINENKEIGKGKLILQ